MPIQSSFKTGTASRHQPQSRPRWQTDNMTSLPFLLLIYLVSRVRCIKVEPVFHAAGRVVEMGYCFGVDYIVVFKSTPQGDLLLGNSSGDAAALPAPAEFRGRIDINGHQHPLGLQIKNLTHADSGVYRRECWQNQSIVSQHTQELLVCDEEVESLDIVVKEQDASVELRCGGSSAGLEGTSVRWYYESFPSYEVALFLDTHVSQEPLSELPGLVRVQQNGEVLSLDKSSLKPNQIYYCVVVRDSKCLSFRSMHLPDNSESTEIFASEGDAVVLKCPTDGYNQQWKTPLGVMNSSSETQGQMKAAFEEESDDFVLVISAVSEEHSGKYSCHSSSFEMQYSLVLCPKKHSQEMFVFLGQDVSLGCDVNETATLRIQWHRLHPSGGHELIHDSGDETIALPWDLRGRLTMSNNSNSMTISNLTEGDLRTYWCVVAEASPFLDRADYTGDYVEDYSGEGEYGDNHHWHDSHRCIFKQDTFLSFVPDREAKLPQTPDKNVSAYAVGAGLVCLLVVWAAILTIIIKRRTKLSCSGHSSANDMKADVDPDCTRRLTNNSVSCITDTETPGNLTVATFT